MPKGNTQNNRKFKEPLCKSNNLKKIKIRPRVEFNMCKANYGTAQSNYQAVEIITDNIHLICPTNACAGLMFGVT